MLPSMTPGLPSTGMSSGDGAASYDVQAFEADLTALAADDWTAGDGPWSVATTGDLDSVTIAAYNDGNATTLGPDGSNGVVIDPSGAQQQNGTVDNAPGFSWTPSTVTAAQTSFAVGAYVQVESAPDNPKNSSLVLSLVASAGANPTAAQLRWQDDDSAYLRQLGAGGTDDLGNSAIGGHPRRLALVRVGGGVYAYYSTSTGAVSASDWATMVGGSAPSGWAQVTGTYGPYMAIQNTPNADTRLYDASPTNADPFAVLVSTNQATGVNFVLERFGGCFYKAVIS